MRHVSQIASEIIFKAIISGKLGRADVRQESPNQYAVRQYLIAMFKDSRVEGKCH